MQNPPYSRCTSVQWEQLKDVQHPSFSRQIYKNDQNSLSVITVQNFVLIGLAIRDMSYQYNDSTAVVCDIRDMSYQYNDSTAVVCDIRDMLYQYNDSTAVVCDIRDMSYQYNDSTAVVCDIRDMWYQYNDSTEVVCDIRDMSYQYNDSTEVVCDIFPSTVDWYTIKTANKNTSFTSLIVYTHL